MNTTNLSNELSEMPTKHIKERQEEYNRKLYQFEKNKLYDYLGTHLVNKLKEHKCFIAGGAITSLFTNSEINDLDIYFRNEKSIIKFVENCWEDNDWLNALTKKAVLVRMDDRDVQLIHFKYFNSAQEIFDTFDFTVCMGAFDFETEQFVLHDEFLKHNSQKIIKFNKDTAFPIVSLLRVHKYNKKNYSISKPEFLRIVLKCMSLDIQSAEELKDHLGGMYGINFDKIIDFLEGEEFSLDKVIDKIENLSLHEDYFKKPESLKFEDIEDVIELIQKRKMKITTIKDKVYKIRYNDTLKYIGETKPAFYEEVNGKEYVEGRKFYKFVKKESNDTYSSHYTSSFKYKIGEIATAQGKCLYFTEKNEINDSSYYDHGVLIECEITYDDFIKKDNDTAKVQAKSCKVIREVPKEEWLKWVDGSKEDEPEDPFEIDE